MWLSHTFKQKVANSKQLKSNLRQLQNRQQVVMWNYLYWSHLGVLYWSGKNGPVKADGKTKCPLPGEWHRSKDNERFPLKPALQLSNVLVTLYWDVYRCGMDRQFSLLQNRFPKRTKENELVWSHLFLEEILPILQGSQPVLLVFMLQVLIWGVEVADEVLQTQAHRLNWQVNGGRLWFLAESIQAPKSTASISIVSDPQFQFNVLWLADDLTLTPPLIESTV